MLEAKRTLVKSGPELWAEVSDPAALGRHLAAFGDLRITRTEAEALVEWEAERAAGSVTLAESGFGTRVVLTARVALQAAEPEPSPQVEVEAEAEAGPRPEVEPEPAGGEPPRRGFWTRLFKRRRPEAATPAPVAEPLPAEPEPAPPPPARPVPAIADDEVLTTLTATLDALGRAHHRPFSRA
jgi:hypothetical protein